MSQRIATRLLVAIVIASVLLEASANIATQCASLNREVGSGPGCGACKPGAFGLPSGSLCKCEVPVDLYAMRFRAFDKHAGEPKLFLGAFPSNWGTGAFRGNTNIAKEKFLPTNTFTFSSNGAGVLSATLNGDVSATYDASAATHPTCGNSGLNVVQVFLRTQGTAGVALQTLTLGGSGSPFSVSSINSAGATVTYPYIGNSRLNPFSFSGSFNIANRTACTSNELCSIQITVGCIPADPIEILPVARFRAFNAGAQNLFVGRGDVGVAANRHVLDSPWSNGATNVRFYRNGANIVAVKGSSSQTFMLPETSTCTADKFNFFRISVREAAGAGISVSNLLVNGQSLAAPAASSAGTVAEFLNVANLASFDITATINLGSKSLCTSQEGCRVELQIGCHPTCTAPFLEEPPISLCDCPSKKIFDGCQDTYVQGTGKCVCLVASDDAGVCNSGDLECVQ